MKLKWTSVARRLETAADEPRWGLDRTPTDGQRDALAAIAERLRLGQRSLLIADEVGTGKTMLAVMLIKAVEAEGGRTAVILPPGLGAQWQRELRRIDPEDRALAPLRGYSTFLEAYGQPEDVSDQEGERRSHERRLQTRRMLGELPSGLWSEQRTLLLSHTLGIVRQTPGATPVIEHVRKVVEGVRRYRRDPKAGWEGHPRAGADHNVARSAAEAILRTLCARDRQWLLATLTDGTNGPIDQLQAIMRRGLGRFDLVVIDEAHKARGPASSLSTVIGELVWESSQAFRIGLTATPVELDAQQWISTLRRLGVDPQALDCIAEAVERYVSVVEDLRTKVALTPESVGRYVEAAERYRDFLRPWVLRRSLRDDEFVRRFRKLRGAHREIRPIEVSLSDMTVMWRRAFLASEGMSLLTEAELTPAQRRLRLSLPDGRCPTTADEPPGSVALTPRTRVQHAWATLAREAMGEGGSSVLSHPAILRAVSEIEAMVAQGHKVLVFGVYLQPMRALTSLLDAREMVRRLCADESPLSRWPGSTLPKIASLQDRALRDALADPRVNTAGLDYDAAGKRLEDRADAYARSRSANLAEMRAEIEQVAQSGDTAAALLSEAWRSSSTGSDAGLLAALEDRRDSDRRNRLWTGPEIVDAFTRIRRELRSSSDGEEASGRFAEQLTAYLKDFTSRDGHFARMMYGETGISTRLLLQAAFNREASWPQVLVAQSRVAREGLNLQDSCRMVVLLHLEWNPGNVEQQIGRVDRIGSRWRREAEAWMADGAGEAPRILIRPVIVRQTYADRHWAVLHRRWRNLRAQLDGEILDLDGSTHYAADLERLVRQVQAAVPDFSPPRRCRGGATRR